MQSEPRSVPNRTNQGRFFNQGRDPGSSPSSDARSAPSPMLAEQHEPRESRRTIVEFHADEVDACRKPAACRVRRVPRQGPATRLPGAPGEARDRSARHVHDFEGDAARRGEIEGELRGTGRRVRRSRRGRAELKRSRRSRSRPRRCARCARTAGSGAWTPPMKEPPTRAGGGFDVGSGGRHDRERPGIVNAQGRAVDESGIDSMASSCTSQRAASLRCRA